jgi:hypothetical protein
VDERYKPFAARLCQMAEEFDEDQVLELIEHFMGASWQPGS